MWQVERRLDQRYFATASVAPNLQLQLRPQRRRRRQLQRRLRYRRRRQLPIQRSRRLLRRPRRPLCPRRPFRARRQLPCRRPRRLTSVWEFGRAAEQRCHTRKVSRVRGSRGQSSTSPEVRCSGYVCALISGIRYISAPQTGSSYTTALTIYDAATDSWSSGPSVSCPTNAFTSCAYDYR